MGVARTLAGVWFYPEGHWESQALSSRVTSSPGCWVSSWEAVRIIQVKDDGKSGEK